MLPPGIESGPKAFQAVTLSTELKKRSEEVSVEGYTGSGSTVFMYSATSGDGGVTLQLRDSDEMDDKSEGLGSVLARIHHQPDNTLSISYPSDIDGSIDVLLATSTLNTSGDAGSGGFDLFDSDNGQDLTLSPQTFTSSTEAFINDNSNSLGVSCNDNDTVGSTEDVKAAADSSKLAVKKARPKPASPNRQGPQQCQVCGKVFGNASALAKHKLTHSDERKYVCAMCAKAFKRQDHLNGHMLTHRNKKPYECKAEGCGKSYCDARSLRRHRENHHAAATAPTSTTPSPVSEQNSPPLSSSCIQYAPPPPPKPSQLQQLLATQPSTDNKSSSGQNNDGLTKQQLELIQQIMQQTKEQAAAAAAKTSSASGNAKTVTTTSTTQPATTTATCKPKIWTVQISSRLIRQGISGTCSASAPTLSAASSRVPSQEPFERILEEPAEWVFTSDSTKNVDVFQAYSARNIQDMFCLCADTLGSALSDDFAKTLRADS
ncbi:hypothetical protein AAG570_008176 [Ranatra chinensis]|uniref:C2H2-type domain-containing protein n=1 Tax=Ranatra chinensis TaxID=642074 RepID=A0ABD0YE50_9HEMI